MVRAGPTDGMLPRMRKHALVVLAALTLLPSPALAETGARWLHDVVPDWTSLPADAGPEDRAELLRASGTVLQWEARALSLAADLRGLGPREVGSTAREVADRLIAMRLARAELLTELSLSPRVERQLVEVGTAEGAIWSRLQRLQAALAEAESSPGRVHARSRAVERAATRLADEQDQLLHAAGFKH